MLHAKNNYQTSIETRQENLKDDSYLDCVGLLKANWLNRYGKVRAVNYGTAFLISPRILLTCAHNIYAEELLSQATQIQFVANFSEGSVSQYYSSTQKLIIKRESTDETFKIKPIKEELCLILLQKPLQKNTYPLKLKPANLVQIQKDSRLKIVGYPSQNFARSPSIKDIYFKRKELQGEVSDVQNFTIFHTAKTQPGISGSPIISFTQQGQPFVVGIHTHRAARGINSGLFFSRQIISRIEIYVDEINREYRMDQKINFINQIGEKEECWTKDSDSEYENTSHIELDQEWLQFINSQQYLKGPQETQSKFVDQ